ncbi:hypothetical protein [Azotosporobacter soli]|uniref:hypothetical protein n=1 Tax=Azotosporobacter soli TaxID=3055040 RepID=UPI0031FE9473
MNMKIIALTLGVLLSSATAFASPVEFSKGSLELELGATLNAKSAGSGAVAKEVKGKSGYKSVATFGLSDKFALQLKHGNFTSEDAQYGPLKTFVESTPSDFNLLYKLNPTITLIGGYEHTDITYGKAVNAATSSAFHIGFTAARPLSERMTLFTTQMIGNNVSLQEYGLSYKTSKVTTLNVSYADRKIKNVSLEVPALHISGKEDYQMTGITCTVGVKF